MPSSAGYSSCIRARHGVGHGVDTELAGYDRRRACPAYNYVTDKGALALNDYARTNDPFSKIGKAQVAVDVSSVIRASDDSFRVEWVERHYVDDALAATERWSAILTIVVQTPTDADRLKKNPLGVYVHALNWSKELG